MLNVFDLKELYKITRLYVYKSIALKPKTEVNKEEENEETGGKKNGKIVLSAF